MEPRTEQELEPQRHNLGLSEDDVAREMIERIARQVDLESGRAPLHSETEDVAEDEPVAEGAEGVEPEPHERSHEDVSRELVERIAREVDEEPRG